MQSNPNAGLLKIIFTLNGKYTKRIASELKVGKEVWLKLPYNDLFSREHKKENLMLQSKGFIWKKE